MLDKIPLSLLSFAETPGASGTINGWLNSGHVVSIITGRPYSAYEPSREWLDLHGLERAKLYCLNKYGRDSFIPVGNHPVAAAVTPPHPP